jgi:hypothetical protein
MLFRRRRPACSISIARGTLESIFDECDRYDVDETGGKLLGTYRQKNGRYDILVNGVLESGPNSQRSPTSLFQDGEYQERLFRSIEASHPDVEHLGSWHTHHVNGYPTLSGGDKTTYFKTVNHEKQNTDFFYALLVVSKKHGGNARYATKHFLFRRGDDTIYEIPTKDVRIVDAPVLRPRHDSESVEARDPSPQHGLQNAPNPERVKDQEFFSEFYPGLKALFSKDIGTPYWKGPLSLVDGSRADVVAMEDRNDKARPYVIATSSKNSIITDLLEQYRERKFRSARHAVLHLERDLNQALYRGKKR